MKTYLFTYADGSTTTYQAPKDSIVESDQNFITIRHNKEILFMSTLFDLKSFSVS